MYPRMMSAFAIGLAIAFAWPNEGLAQVEGDCESLTVNDWYDTANEVAVKCASEAAARAVEDFRVIYGILENAELAVALAERALENAESEEDYAEAWKRHREAAQYRDSVKDIAVRADSLAVSARDNANKAAVAAAPEWVFDAGSRAVRSASEVANLRAQVEG